MPSQGDGRAARCAFRTGGQAKLLHETAVNSDFRVHPVVQVADETGREAAETRAFSVLDRESADRPISTTPAPIRLAARPEADGQGGKGLNHRHVLAFLGFLVGSLIGVYWEWSPPPIEAGVQTQAGPAQTAVLPPAAVPQTADHDQSTYSPEQQEPPVSPSGTRSSEPDRPEGDTSGGEVAPALNTQPEQADPNQPVQAVARSGSAVSVNRILVGEQLVTSGILAESTLAEHGERHQYIVYFELCLEEWAEKQGPPLTDWDFRLEDAAGLTYAPLEFNRALPVSSSAEADCAGVAFAVYNDSAPARVHYRAEGSTFVPLPVHIFTPNRD